LNNQANNKKTKGRNKIERQIFIQSALKIEGFVSISSVCEKFEVSDQTVRNDLAELQKQGICKKSYGGAVPCDIKDGSDSVQWPEEIVDAIKSGLVNNSNALFGRTATVFLPGDSFFLSFMQNFGEIFEKETVFYTDSIALAKHNSELNAHETILLPGRVDPKTERTHGRELEKFLKTSNTIISTALFRINHIDVEQKNVGFSNRLDGIIAEEMMTNNIAKEIILLSMADVFKENRPFHRLKLREPKIRFLVQAVYKDAKGLSETSKIAQKYIHIEVDRTGDNVIHYKKTSV